jgi:hypothetical protein
VLDFLHLSDLNVGKGGGKVRSDFDFQEKKQAQELLYKIQKNPSDEVKQM